MKPVRFGIVGAGGISKAHKRGILDAENAELVAVCDIVEDRAKALAEETDAKVFTDYNDLLDNGDVEAITVGTHHFAHPVVAIAAFERGIHVLCEKPLAVHVAHARRMVAAARKAGCHLATVFQMRTKPLYKRAKALISSGELGPLVRALYLKTSWFRTQHYFDSSGWRGTWDGEGGGVLLNQCPHQLDCLQWLVGPPRRVRAHAAFGKYHDMQTADEVTAYLEWDNGMTGVFITCTGEAPGSDRVEISGDKGRMLIENDKLYLDLLETPASQFLRESRASFAMPPHNREVVEFEGRAGGHRALVENLVHAMRDGAKLICPGEEGLPSLEMGNAMIVTR